MTAVAILLLSGLVAILALLILNPKFRFPLLFETGMFMVLLGALSVVDNLLTNSACTEFALMTRWLLVGGGLFAMLLSIAIRMRKKGSRRITDMVEVADHDLHNVRGRGK